MRQLYWGLSCLQDQNSTLVIQSSRRGEHFRYCSSNTKLFHSSHWELTAGIQQGIGEVICHYLSTLRFIAAGLLRDTRLRKSLPQDLKDFFHLHILDSEQHHCMVQQISHLRSRARLVLILQQCLNQFTCFFTGKYAKGAINKQILTQRQMNEACNYAKSSLFFSSATGCLVS